MLDLRMVNTHTHGYDNLIPWEMNPTSSLNIVNQAYAQ